MPFSYNKFGTFLLNLYGASIGSFYNYQIYKLATDKPTKKKRI